MGGLFGGINLSPPISHFVGRLVRGVMARWGGFLWVGCHTLCDYQPAPTSLVGKSWLVGTLCVTINWLLPPPHPARPPPQGCGIGGLVMATSPCEVAINQPTYLPPPNLPHRKWTVGLAMLILKFPLETCLSTLPCWSAVHPTGWNAQGLARPHFLLDGKGGHGKVEGVNVGWLSHYVWLPTCTYFPPPCLTPPWRGVLGGLVLATSLCEVANTQPTYHHPPYHPPFH